MEIKITPSSDKFEGYVMVRPMTYEEKLDLVDELKGDVDVTDEKEIEKLATKNMAKMAKVLAKKAREHCTKVALVRKEDGYKFEKYEDLSYDTDGHEVIQEIGAKLLNKMHVGKN